MRVLAIILFMTVFASFNPAHADNVFRPQKNTNIEQTNKFVPQALVPLVQKIRKLQAQYLNQVTQNLRDIKQGEKSVLPVSLLFLSFLYGLLHAAGPGHGKAVISAYLLSNKAQLRQGIFMAFAAAMLQAVTAIIIVFAGLFIFKSSVRAINLNFSYFEQFSYFLIAILGLYLLITNFRKMRQRKVHIHHHDDDCGCGHSHMPSPETKATSLKQKALTIFSIGIRPCTGALIILILAHSLGLYMVAIVATFLMALGTFITISLVASFAVSIQSISSKFGEKLPAKFNNIYLYSIDGLKILLSLFILGFGILLILATM